MLIRKKTVFELPAAEITPPDLLRRRHLLQAAGLAALTAHLPSGLAAPRFAGVRRSTLSTDETPNSRHDITTYNNYYEFGTDKDEPAKYAGRLKTRPWTVQVEGLVKRPTSFAIDELLTRFPLEERVYRLRCVEGWSMVIPWVGFPLASLLKAVEPLGSARFVEFESVVDRQAMPRQALTALPWPYVEGLRLDEALHPLTLLAVGLYGEVLPNQNGAPLRLVVPWKYGFKSGKSIVRIRLRETLPTTTWVRVSPEEYGFYANVNPEVNHPRWSQATERRLGEFRKRKTLPFNGYGEQVAALYSGMDLRVNF